MVELKRQSPPLLVKWLNSCLKHNFTLHFLFFVIGLSLGLTACTCLRSFSFNFQATILSPWSFSSPPPPLPSPREITLPLTSQNLSVMHSMDDDELFWRATLVPMIQDYLPNHDQHVPKLAFMFLAKGPIPLTPLWELFFQGHQGLYSIYIHSDPSYDDYSLPLDSVFYRRRIPSKVVEWGKASMIDAERRLLANALLDYTNQRFILLSETCIPLFNFTTIYTYLISTNQSFVASYDDPRKIGRGRYNPQMSPLISVLDWRKGSQWFEITRSLAVKVISDKKYYPLFRDFCHPPCYSDEHYFPTVLNILSPEMNSNWSITWVDWSKSGPHPGKFNKQHVTQEFLDEIRFGSSNCSYNGEFSSVCFLFARKFLSNTLQPLLQLAPNILFT